MPASVNDTPSSPSPRISVSLARAACTAPPKNSVLRPTLPLPADGVGTGTPALAPLLPTTAWAPLGRGPTCVDTSNADGGGMRAPHAGQKRLCGPTGSLHFGHAVVAAIGPDGASAITGGGDDAFTLRGSRATGKPQRLHCGTPIGVNALHASHTRPTSIRRKFYPLGCPERKAT